ncbi:hypothetical protein Sste5346_004331 [Sporothrix stenoceras]|uniref:Uncharacterized protein n=1 Tax=Sporothrix stenoceras TaxID=5173 RepID=A0ABR3Z8Y3_9PEZI
MTSLSLFTGPMALLTAAASASDIFALQAPKAPAHTSTAGPSPSQLPAKTQPVDVSSPHPPANMATTTTTTTTNTNNHLPLSLRSPSADLIYRCHSSAVHAWTLVATAAKPGAWAAHHTARLLLVLGTFLAVTAQMCAVRCGQAVWQACWWHLWACKPATRLRKKLYFEVALAFMGPSGNGLLLVVLWPGWLVLAAAVWGVSAAVAALMGGA